MISAINFAPTTAHEAAPPRESYGDDQAKDRFAGMLASATQAHAHGAKRAVKPHGGTSELDGTDATQEDRETSGGTDDADGTTDSSSTASSTTAASPSAGATTSPGNDGVVRSVAALTPELQAKLARVIDRVRSETGHDVSVAETYRSQSRQAALFAQGRETPGQVVTWTQNSKHTQGRAVDLLLDGGAATSDAYAALQRIATEEGLHTLGARDPGHLELPGAATAATMTTTTAKGDVTSLLPAAPADATGPGQVSIARIAQVAKVAQVATVANVATAATVAPVAGVAQVADPRSFRVPRAPQAVTAPQAGTAPRTGAVNAISSTQLGQADTDGSDTTGSDTSGRSSQGDQRGGYASLGTFTMRESHTAAAAPAVAGSTAAERTERVQAALDNAPARPLSQITMNVDAGNGTSDRIHVALRGASLNTTIDVSDARAAQTMSARSDELVRALNRDGMEVESMRVRAAATTAAPTAAPTSQGSTDSSTGSRFERGGAWQQQERQRAQDERRQQQRNQRGEPTE